MNDLFPTFKTERLLLRKFVETDLESVFEGLSNPDVIKYYGVSYPTLEDAKKQMTWFEELTEKGTGIWWAIISPGNEFLGAGGLNNVSTAHQKAELGYWLLPQHWGKGIIAEALPLICGYGFEKLGLHRIEATVEAGNVNSMRVLERLEFQHEGTLKECEFKNGEFISIHVYSKLSPDAFW